ncbi:hypothetical protein COLO4_30452 [Corchorus olitorius]|uniref:Uncharacterized protein n=1 Tax=Corchorus olitorius TaxID=93759 RepID=A0A1R3H8L0_9ROSI|nr:hypothetical protein COLO4_30452 [Corchorus olitorius]
MNTKLRTILYCSGWTRGIKEAVNHALITRSWSINQTRDPVSFVLKDTEVRAYRTDPVQVFILRGYRLVCKEHIESSKVCIALRKE